MAGNLTAMIAAAFSGGAAPPVTTDPYFEYTTLLLPGNGTNGAQNNTFLDGSTNNFTITRNGNTTQGTFSPFSQTGWGNYFNGSNYLSIATTSALQLSNSVAWTIELWLYATALPAVQSYPFMAYNLSSPYSGWGIGFNGGGTASPSTLQFWDGSSWRNIATGLTANTWYHIAISYEGSGTTGRFFLDGVQQGTAFAPSASINNTVSSVSLGAQNSGALGYTGYISNARIVKGRAVYTSAFTPPTTPLTRTTGGTNPPQGTECSLLTCQSNRFLDSNGVNVPASSPLTITANGSPTVVAFSPFNPSASWSAATYGGSGYFDGSGDYLTTPSNTSFAFGGNWTIEFWLYPLSQSSAGAGLIAFSDNKDNIDYTLSSNSLLYYNGSTPTTFTGVSVTVASWNHIAVVNASGTVRAYVNGSQSTNSASGVTTSSARSFNILANIVGSAITGGYVSGLRVVNGTAVYTGAFTPPTAPISTSGSASASAYPSTTNVNTSFASSDTKLLLNCTNAGIYDATSKNDLETVGNAQISTAISAKWGSGSMYFDGTTDYLTNNNYSNPLLAFGAGDFTVEYWVYTTSNANIGMLQISSTSGGFQTSTSNTISLAFSSNRTITVTYANTSALSASSAVGSGVWTHIALVRKSNALKLYVDGTADLTFGTKTDNTNYTGTYIVVGGYYSSSYTLNGYLQDVRITRYARYDGNFTAPTAAFPTL